jgi:hemoglobin
MNKLFRGLVIGLTVFCMGSVMTTAQAQMDPAPANPDLKPVFEDFGGEEGLTLLMDDFMTIMLNNDQLRPFFADANQERVKRHLVEQFCVILGGDCKYTGGNMLDLHAQMEIDRADFNALVEDLQTAMNRHDIPFRSQNKLIAELAPMHREIITQ